jgi:hypothetical protein
MDQARTITVVTLVLGAFVAVVSAVGIHKLGPISAVGLPVGLWVSIRAGASLARSPVESSMSRDSSSIGFAWFLIGSVAALVISIALFIWIGGVFTEKLVLLSTFVLIILVPVAAGLGMLELGKKLVRRRGNKESQP